MASENVENLKRAFEALEQGDLETATAQIDPDFQIGRRAVPEAASDLRGPEALLANVDQLREVFGDARWRALEIVDLGERLLVRVRIEGTAGHTGLPMAEDIGHIYTLNSGRVVRLDIFRTWDEARSAAGLLD